jgi:hypothetical protein
MSIRTELRGPRGVTALCVGFAAIYLSVGLATRDPWVAVAGPIVMLAYLGFLYTFRSRSESVSLLSGATEDERQRTLVMQASAITGNVLIAAVVTGFFVALATGATTAAHVLSGVGAIGGVTFAVAVFWLSRHR